MSRRRKNSESGFGLLPRHTSAIGEGRLSAAPSLCVSASSRRRKNSESGFGLLPRHTNAIGEGRLSTSPSLCVSASSRRRKNSESGFGLLPRHTNAIGEGRLSTSPSLCVSASSRRRKNSESGFALLLVFLMAAMVAISLYMEAPRLAFQAQRQKEQILMERGEQYKRAIGLFLRTNKNTRWPATIEELENFNNHRFLRHRYIDPMTGKDEWRLIHISNGVLTDSVTNKKKDQQDHLSKNGSVMELAGLAGMDSSGQTSVNAANRRRPSEGGGSQNVPEGQSFPGITQPPPPTGGGFGARR